MNARVVLFLLAMLVVLGAASRYLLRRSADAFSLGPRARRGLGALLFGALAVIILARAGERRLPADALRPVAAAGFAVALASAISATILAILDILAAAARLPARLRRLPAPPLPAADPPAAPPILRRSFISQATAGAALAVGGGSSFYGTFRGRHDYALEEVPIRIAGLGRALDGFTIVQLSDVHLGLFVGDREIAAAEELVRKARPDLIVLTGDLVDHDPREATSLGRMVTRLLPLARGGVIAIPGNHDYFAGADRVLAAVTRAGGRALVNEGLAIGGASGFALLGLDDVHGPRVDPRSTGPSIERALATVREAADLPRVVLCHNPVTFPKNAGRAALQLSGHTHGGQINVGVRLADLVLGHPYIAGRYEREGSQIYVNRGFGTAGPPARVGSAPEVTRIVLVSG